MAEMWLFIVRKSGVDAFIWVPELLWVLLNTFGTEVGKSKKLVLGKYFGGFQIIIKKCFL